MIRCWLNPSLAPTYDVSHVRAREKVRSFLIHILPLTFVIFMVIGVMFLGVATPTEAATSGALGAIILAACQQKVDLGRDKEISHWDHACYHHGVYDRGRVHGFLPDAGLFSGQ